MFDSFCWCWRPWTLSCHDPQIDFFVLLLNTHFLFLVFQEINCSFILFMLKLIYDKSLWYTILFLVTVFFFLLLWTIYNLDFLFVIRQSLFGPISFYIIINWFHHLTPKTWRRKKKISFMLVLLWLRDRPNITWSKIFDFSGSTLPPSTQALWDSFGK